MAYDPVRRVAPTREIAERTRTDGDRAMVSGRRGHVWASALLLSAAMLWPGDAKAAQLSLAWINNASDAAGFAVERSTGV